MKCRLDHRRYKLGVKISDEQMKSIKIKPNKSHGEWNYIIYSQKRKA
ncbi:MAG: hypothetical protein LBR80_02675 [Deltaproteobacteria bacterium]|nr:hypothetical protein [Deltaproteobacteria bacterium]